MLTIHAPHIIVYRVSNGWLVQWQVPKQARHDAFNTIERLCLTDADLLDAVNTAAKETPR
jgi:hypothetical protein